MPDENLPAVSGTKTPPSSSIEEDFPTLENQSTLPASETPAPAYFKSPGTSTAPATASNPSATPTFSPLGGPAPIDIEGNDPRAAHLQYRARPNIPIAFETLAKVTLDNHLEQYTIVPKETIIQSHPGNPISNALITLFSILLLMGISGVIYASYYGYLDLSKLPDLLGQYITLPKPR